MFNIYEYILKYNACVAIKIQLGMCKTEMPETQDYLMQYH